MVGAVRLVLVPIGVVWLVWKAAGTALPAVSVSADILVLALLLNQAALALFAARIRLSLAITEIGIDWRTAMRIHLQSVFYLFALPTTVGLDISRYLKVRAVDQSASVGRIWGGLLFDRFIGLIASQLMLLACLPFVRIELMSAIEPYVWFIVAGGLAGAVGLCVAVVYVQRIRVWLITALEIARRHWLRTLAVIAVGVATNLAAAWAVSIAAAAIDLEVAVLDAVVAMCGSMLLVLIPISVGGIGLAEAGTVGIFILLGYPPAAAVTAGAIPYLLRLFGALQGGVLEFVESSGTTVSAVRASAAAREMSGRSQGPSA